MFCVDLADIILSNLYEHDLSKDELMFLTFCVGPTHSFKVEMLQYVFDYREIPRKYMASEKVLAKFITSFDSDSWTFDQQYAIVNHSSLHLQVLSGFIDGKQLSIIKKLSYKHFQKCYDYMNDRSVGSLWDCMVDNMLEFGYISFQEYLDTFHCDALPTYFWKIKTVEDVHAVIAKCGELRFCEYVHVQMRRGVRSAPFMPFMAIGQARTDILGEISLRTLSKYQSFRMQRFLIHNYLQCNANELLNHITERAGSYFHCIPDLLEKYRTLVSETVFDQAFVELLSSKPEVFCRHKWFDPGRQEHLDAYLCRLRCCYTNGRSVYNMYMVLQRHPCIMFKLPQQILQWVVSNMVSDILVDILNTLSKSKYKNRIHEIIDQLS